MYSRKDLMNIFKIKLNGIIKLEYELNLHDSSNKKNKIYTDEQFSQIRRVIEEKYSLPCEAKIIDDSYDYACKDGRIFKQSGNTGLYIEAKIQKVYGYAYCGIKYKTGVKSSRVHRVIAKAFIKNNDEANKTCINHIDGDKLNNHVNNLEWCTVSENTKHAFDNGLAKNDKGFDDSQSIAVDKYDINGELIETYGSIGEASVKCKIPKNTLINQCKNNSYPRKYNFYFRYRDKS